MIARPPVAITGMGCLCAAGANLPSCIQNLFSDRRDPKPPRNLAAIHPVVYPVFEPPEGTLDRTARMAVHTASEALTHAGWTRETLRGVRAGVCMGTHEGCSANMDVLFKDGRKGLKMVPPAQRFLSGNPAEAIARKWDLSGPVQTVVSACSSGTDAIGLAASWIQAGICDLAIAGGADALYQITYNGFISMMLYDSSPCRPFDERRKGLNLGAGAGVMVLESEQLFKKRNRVPDLQVLGYGAACDAFHFTKPHPEGAGLKKAIADALAISGLESTGICFINAHGTGTQDNDLAEARVLSELFPHVPFHSTKGHTGHTLAAAGAMEAVFTAAFLKAGRIPASAGFEIPDPDLPAVPSHQAQHVTGRAALSQTLAFGGGNSVLIIGTQARL